MNVTTGCNQRIAVLVISLLLFTAPLALADTDEELSQKIVGAWSERNHEVTFLQNGEWRLAKNGLATPGLFRWHIKDGKLIEFRDRVTFSPQKIVWVRVSLIRAATKL